MAYSYHFLIIFSISLTTFNHNSAIKNDLSKVNDSSCHFKFHCISLNFQIYHQKPKKQTKNPNKNLQKSSQFLWNRNVGQRCGWSVSQHLVALFSQLLISDKGTLPHHMEKKRQKKFVVNLSELCHLHFGDDRFVYLNSFLIIP